MNLFRRRSRSTPENSPSSSAELMTAAKTLRRAVDARASVLLSAEVAKAMASLLELEETYLIEAPCNEKLAHVQMAFHLARAINAESRLH